MTIYIRGPNGKPMAFADEAEVDAYRRARREAEPAWLQRLREYHSDVFKLDRQAASALEQRSGRSAALDRIRGRLRSLQLAMAEDIEAAEREINRPQEEASDEHAAEFQS